jgi:hypothetical protein
VAVADMAAGRCPIGDAPVAPAYAAMSLRSPAQKFGTQSVHVVRNFTSWFACRAATMRSTSAGSNMTGAVRVVVLTPDWTWLAATIATSSLETGIHIIAVHCLMSAPTRG